MHLEFRYSPLVPVGIKRIIRRVVKDLREVIPLLSYTQREDIDLMKYENKQKIRWSHVRWHNNQRKIVIYIFSNSFWYGNETVYGLAWKRAVVVSQYFVATIPGEYWFACLWKILLHELGHSFGLVSAEAKRKVVINDDCPLFHCSFDCVMDDNFVGTTWHDSALSRMASRSPFCRDCRVFLKRTHATKNST